MRFLLNAILSVSCKSLLSIFVLIAGLIACQKDDSPSANHVRFSINDSVEATCGSIIRPGYDFIGGPNCEFEFDRNGLFATGSGTAEIGLFAGYHCELMTSPLPYQTKLFTVVINLNPTPWETVSYAYIHDNAPDTLSNTPGDLLLTLTQRDNNHVKGKITGTIYRTNVGLNLLPSKFNCSFDLAIPLVK